MEEIWKDIEGYNGKYQISNMSNVRRIGYLGSIYKLDCGIANNGYKRVSLRIGNKIKYFNIHRLVAVSFIPNIKNEKWINHKNGIKTDNSIENLEWCSPSYNLKHARDNGLNKGVFGISSHSCKLSEEDVLWIRENFNNVGYLEITKKYKIANTTVYAIINRKKWKHI